MKKKNLLLNWLMIVLVIVLFVLVFDFTDFARTLGVLGAFSGAFVSIVVAKSIKKI